MVVKVAPAGDDATANNLNTENGVIAQQPGIEPGTNKPHRGQRRIGIWATKFWYLSYYRTSKVKARLQISADSPEPSDLDVDKDSGKT